MTHRFDLKYCWFRMLAATDTNVGGGNGNRPAKPDRDAAFDLAFWQAVNHLRTYAQAGHVEASYLLDLNTGAMLDFAVAALYDPHTVDHDADKIVGHERVVNIHAHLNDLPPGANDWMQLIDFPQMQSVYAVGPTIMYRLTKPAEWRAPTLSQSAFLFFLSHVRLNQRKYWLARQHFEELPVAAQEAILHDTNIEMAQRYGVAYGREVLG